MLSISGDRVTQERFTLNQEILEDIRSPESLLQLEVSSSDLLRFFRGEPLAVECLRCLNSTTKDALKKLLLKLIS